MQSPNDLVYYELTGNAEAQNYFQVDRLNGEISVRTSLTSDTNNPANYRVRWHRFLAGTAVFGWLLLFLSLFPTDTSLWGVSINKSMF